MSSTRIAINPAAIAQNTILGTPLVSGGLITPAPVLTLGGGGSLVDITISFVWVHNDYIICGAIYKDISSCSLYLITICA